MNYVVAMRPAYHVAPRAENRLASLEACRDYIAEKKAEGKIDRVYWMNVMPYGSSEDLMGLMWLNADSHAEAWEILSNYPGYKVEGGVEFEMWGELGPNQFYSQALKAMETGEEDS